MIDFIKTFNLPNVYKSYSNKILIYKIICLYNPNTLLGLFSKDFQPGENIEESISKHIKSVARMFNLDYFQRSLDCEIISLILFSERSQFMGYADLEVCRKEVFGDDYRNFAFIPVEENGMINLLKTLDTVEKIKDGSTDLNVEVVEKIKEKYFMFF